MQRDMLFEELRSIQAISYEENVRLNSYIEKTDEELWKTRTEKDNI
jgi:hypothetical protein